MSSEWPLVQLADHVESCLGKMLDAKKNKGVLQPYLGNSNVRWGKFDIADLAEMKFEAHEEARYGLRTGDLVVCEGGEPGRCAIWNGPTGMKIQKALHRIRPRETLDNYYLFYWFCLAARNGHLEAHFTGTTIKHLTGKAIAALKVPLPPIGTQRAMVDALRSLDARISLIRETNDTLEAIAKALFKSWFIDFDPVRAKTEGREPDGMDAVTAALFPDSFEESELGLVPRGWAVRKVENVMALQYGKALKATDRVDGDVPVYGSGGITGYHNEALINGPSVIVGRKGTVGSLYWEDRPFFPIDTVFYVMTDNPLTYCYHLLQTLGLESMNTDGAVPGLNRNNAYRLPVVVAPTSILESFDKIVSSLRDKIFANNQNAQNLTQLRDTLLPRLISGQMSLPETEVASETMLSEEV